MCVCVCIIHFIILVNQNPKQDCVDYKVKVGRKLADGIDLEG